MGDLFTRLRLWVIFRVRLHKASTAQKIAWKWKCDAFLALKNLNNAIERLGVVREEAKSEGKLLLRQYETVQNKVFAQTEAALGELEEARRVITRYDHAEAALTSELEVIKDVTLKDLILQRAVTREQLKSDVAALMGRNPPPDSEE
jgi:hypothetical protein